MPPRETRRPLLRPNLLETRSSLGLRTKYRSFEYFLTYLHVKGSRRRSDQVTLRFEQRVRTNTYARVCSKSFVGKTINALRSSVLRQLAFSKAASKERARQKTRQEKKKDWRGDRNDFSSTRQAPSHRCSPLLPRYRFELNSFFFLSSGTYALDFYHFRLFHITSRILQPFNRKYSLFHSLPFSLSLSSPPRSFSLSLSQSGIPILAIFLAFLKICTILYFVR